jgi:pilus assembly protein CpaB
VRRRTIAISVAVVLALAAAGLVVWYVSSLKHENQTAEQTQAVLVAKVDIPQTTTGEVIIEKGLVEEQQVVVSGVVPGALTSESSLQGKVMAVPVAKGQQLLLSQLGAPEEQSLSFQIDAGMRAISLPVDRMNGVGGAIKKGDRVDVIATFKVEQFQQALLPLGAVLPPAEVERVKSLTGIDLTKTISPYSRVLVQQVPVLAMDNLMPITQSASASGVFNSSSDKTQEVPDTPVITLMVTPADAEKLVFAEQLGTVWFTLVPTADKDKVSTPGQALPNIFR